MLLRDVLTKGFLQKAYVEDRRFARDIAREVGCSTVSVTNYLRKHGILIEPRYEERRGYLGTVNPAREILTQEYLREEYVRKNRSQTSIAQELNCSITLVREALIREGIDVDKGKPAVFLANENSRYGGYIVEDAGYLCIRLPNHPKSNNRGYVRLHVILAEYFSGREVAENEVVHHLNGNRQDNRAENLEIMDKKEHDRFHTCKRHETQRKFGS